MRMTVHLFPTEDYGWLAPLFRERIIRGLARAAADPGVEDAQRDRALLRCAERDPKARRDDCAARSWTSRSAPGLEVTIEVRTHLTMLLVVAGDACIGPDVGREIRSGRDAGLDRRGQGTAAARTRWPSWRGATSLRSRRRPSATSRFGRACRWGIAGSASSGLRQASCDEVEVEGETAYAPRGWTRAGPRSPVVRLLPAFDTYLMGYASRAHAAERRSAEADPPGRRHPAADDLRGRAARRPVVEQALRKRLVDLTRAVRAARRRRARSARGGGRRHRPLRGTLPSCPTVGHSRERHLDHAARRRAARPAPRGQGPVRHRGRPHDVRLRRVRGARARSHRGGGAERLEGRGGSTSGRRTCTSSPTGITSQNPHYGDVPNPRFPELVRGRLERRLRGGARDRRGRPRARAPTAAGRSGFRRPAARSSASSRRSGWCRSTAAFRWRRASTTPGPLARDVAGCAEAMRTLAGVEPAALGAPRRARRWRRLARARRAGGARASGGRCGAVPEPARRSSCRCPRASFPRSRSEIAERPPRPVRAPPRALRAERRDQDRPGPGGHGGAGADGARTPGSATAKRSRPRSRESTW